MSLSLLLEEGRKRARVKETEIEEGRAERECERVGARDMEKRRKYSVRKTERYPSLSPGQRERERERERGGEGERGERERGGERGERERDKKDI